MGLGVHTGLIPCVRLVPLVVSRSEGYILNIIQCAYLVPVVVSRSEGYNLLPLYRHLTILVALCNVALWHILLYTSIYAL